MKYFTHSFLNSIQKHQLTIIENTEYVKCFKMAIPSTHSMSFTVIYADNKAIITGDMGHYVFGRLLNPYNFFLSENTLKASYLTEKVISQDTVYPVQKYNSDVAEQEIRRAIHEYADFDLSKELYESLENIDFESEHEVEHWLYSLEDKARDVFDEVNMSDFTVLSDNFSWCIQAIAWATREFDKMVNDE
ncbi:hypothetical protein Q7472_05570 [Glaesserella parasuis]|uniref:hypothetical protein n=1 Tax=Glaesserella parasuis TaxID=738 RepID=UPI0021BD9EA0|nr:hypothetical protein [Glaesserella parasuis]MCT8829459.1 hypothetical protein [Glaesserella parasuis]MCT8833700.1 hypothetical protein [Glaesserella parasuis]MDG6354837.1 hypothetical protein [Glaesserella parasuis]MDG6429406.1 hypothetical protein [Glaesserella parasuis]MDG6819424.1 hypothetical protein [Glaesserella parasuis]